MSFSSNSIAPGAMRGIMPPHRRAANRSQTTVAARKAGSRACVNQPDRQAAAPAQNPEPAFSRINPLKPEPAAATVQNHKSTFSRINPLNPEPAAAPAQNPKSAFSQINPVNSEPAAAPAQNPKSAFPQINPLNPEPAAAPAQNPKSAFSQINPVNPEPPVQNRKSAISQINPPTPYPSKACFVTCATATSGQVHCFTRSPSGIGRWAGELVSLALPSVRASPRQCRPSNRVNPPFTASFNDTARSNQQDGGRCADVGGVSRRRGPGALHGWRSSR